MILIYILISKYKNYIIFENFILDYTYFDCLQSSIVYFTLIMSSNSSSRKNTQSRRCQEYFQEHWQNFYPSTEATVTFTQPIQPEQQQQQQSQLKGQKKKKSRGNRQLQRFRAKLRKQGLNAEAIAIMTNEDNNPSVHHGDNQRKQTTTAATRHENTENIIELPNQV